ncbi:MAG: NAD(P)/FAD-dependent oxidoreductase [Pleurocapsa sp. MO_226.B13]|nr:NAD(P)/FAD-dependent oxidoreductase [Pleurocapsa sp. MO_226.B13]
MSKKVVIVGAGASGLLLAHYLLIRDRNYQIDIYERRNDPRTTSLSKSRTFPIALNDRGINAIKQIPKLEEAITAVSVEMWGSIIHERSGKQRTIPRKKPLTTLDRTEVIKVLLDTLEQKYDRTRLNIHFQHSCIQVDLAAKEAYFSPASAESEFAVAYDLIVGADGARSTVRKSFLDTKLFELEQKYINNDYKSIFLPSGVDEKSNIALERDRIHSWRLDDGTVVLLLNQFDGRMSGVIHFPRKNNQITKLKSEAEVAQFFEQNFPKLGQLIPKSEVAAFLTRPVATTLTIRCNRYHYGNSALLIGDAAHAVSPSLGQGCNSALEDAFIFNQLLDESDDDLTQALKRFTEVRLADAHAVVELSDNTLPFAKSLFVEFILRQRLAGVLHRFFPQRFLPPLFEALNDTSISYSKIWREYQSWCNKVKKSKQEFVDAL